jgi:hypothetical protein
MGVKLTLFAPLVTAGVTAATLAIAPIAAAAATHGAGGGGASSASSDSAPGQQTCLTLGGTQSQCQSPGNVQIYDAPPQVDFFPYAGGAT